MNKAVVECCAYVQSCLNVPYFASHQRVREVYFGVPQSRDESKAELSRAILLQYFLREGVHTWRHMYTERATHVNSDEILERLAHFEAFYV